ncbi:tRNA (guanine(6)-N(2))-methyltransferase THUMP3-like [Lycorma delicatula]|uniref:tRNA (guanine(6)-N(2))-methyltransferase THUMP3-like n=1 Tax=Lycorma delicatula TaxID=130591 RepID=UPI003F513075
MDLADKVNIYRLVNETASNPELVTIEGTVDTGFEFLALDECKELFGKSVNPCRSRGRIFFNVELKDIDKIKTLRSVDNLFLVAAAVKSLDFDKESKEEDMEKIKQLVNDLDLKRALQVWKSYIKFDGIIFPTMEEYLKADEIRKKEKLIASSGGNVEVKDVEENNVQETAESEIVNVLRFRATCNRTGNHPFTSNDVARDFGGQLQDNYHWIVDLSSYNLEVLLNINENEAYVCFALTKESMHKRNIVCFGPTTLRATHCYNMLRMAELKVGDIVVDPLCGGGSIPIEGTLAFPRSFYIGGDIHEKAVERSDLNRAHVSTVHGFPITLDIFHWDITKLPLKGASVDVFATDLPFGKRSGKKSNNRPLYTNTLKEMARVVRPTTGRAVLLTHDKKTFSQVLSKMAMYWNQPRPYNINLGGLDGGVFLLRRTSRIYL